MQSAKSEPERCWYDRFRIGVPGCQKPGIYGRPNADNAFSRATRWCEEHKHANDELLVPVQHAPDIWRCEGCGEQFSEHRLGHSRTGHAPGCDGSCRNCPVEIQCGPVTQVQR